MDLAGPVPGHVVSRPRGRGSRGAFLRGKQQAARYFFRVELPRTGPQFDLLAALDTVAAETDPDWL